MCLGDSLRRLDSKRGCYGQLFLRPCGKKVVKVFFNRESEGKTRDEIESTFNSEVSAYGKVSHHEELLQLTPKFYGKVDVSQELGISDDYYTDLAYEMEFISGRFDPINSYFIQPYSSKHVIKLFESIGVDAIDSAATYNEIGIIQKVVDFGIKK